VTAGDAFLIVVLLLANGFFVAVEFAVLASRRTRLEPLAEQGNARARSALTAMRELNLQLAGAQLGITMASLVLGFVAEPALASALEDLLEPIIDLPDAALHTIGVVIGLTIVVFLHMVVGEMVPKNIAIAQPERTLLWLVVPNRLYLLVFKPAVKALNVMANALIRLCGVEPRDELATARTVDELAALVRISRAQGLIEEDEHALLTAALVLGGRRVNTVMVPRDQIISVPRTATPAEAEQLVVEHGHSRLLVTGRDLDDVLGFIHAKDLLTIPAGGRDRTLPLGRVRRMLVIGTDAKLEDVLVAMQRARLHFAVVEDRTGRTAGIATLEDVLEALVGDIRDESDPSPSPR
jgi:CBS domain containing-hemolysin-like protein